MPSKLHLGVVVLNWNSSGLTDLCLERCVAESYERKTVIVVDNCSRVDDYHRLQSRWQGQVVLIRNDANLGFAGGTNVGIREAISRGCDMVLLLNNDVRFESSLIDMIVDAFMSDRRLGIASPLVLIDGSDPPMIMSAGGKVGFIRGIAPLHLLGRPSDSAGTEAIHDIDYVSGACMAIRTEVFNDIGVLDESYFAYYEETDFCLRARRSGWRITVLPSVRVWHRYEGHDLQYSQLKSRLLMRNRVLFVMRNSTFGEALLFLSLGLWFEVLKSLGSSNLRRGGQVQMPRILKAPLEGLALHIRTLDERRNLSRSAGMRGLSDTSEGSSR